MRPFVMATWSMYDALHVRSTGCDYLKILTAGKNGAIGSRQVTNGQPEILFHEIWLAANDPLLRHVTA